MKRNILFLLLLCFVASCNASKPENPIVGHWVEFMPVNKQIVQGININSDGSASSIGMATLKYEKWSASNNQITFKGKSIGNGQTIEFTDTLDIIEVTPYTMKLGKFGQYRVDYYRVDEIPDVNSTDNITNLLPKFEGHGDLQTRVYKGSLPAASNPGIVYEITLYNYANSGDGVFKAKLTYLEAANGKDEIFEFAGRQYTLRGSQDDKNATVIQLIPFNNKHEVMNFLRQENKLIMLDREQKKIDSELNYTLVEE